MLEQERTHYQAKLPEWLEAYSNRFVLVKGDSLIGVFDTIEEALSEGARRFGLASFLVRQVTPVPPPVTGYALIDTGASSTCIDAGVAGQLQLPVIDVVTVASASHGATHQNVHPIHIDFAGLQVGIDAPRAIAGPLAVQGIIVLIGRDVLAHGTHHYNGVTGQFTLAI